MLERYAKEFVAIGSFLRANGKLHRGCIIVERKQLEDMLNKNRYDTSLNKLHIWKRLKWIDTDQDGEHFTKRILCADPENPDAKQYKRMIKMELSILEQLEKLVDLGH